ncbi:class I SAM-dependent methyltransferase [Oceanomicrobium pacificus]|uniref:Methyltransferase n=1 Tax=Oceanomicrobium pacificus TaxID=2692916 RepID=A0A6B0TQ64_9RHOB|nr:methyltransferase [Oceanomicrobium pacificus]MXU66820.1 methyltransferase [Oceanomicrobium pacificus]
MQPIERFLMPFDDGHLSLDGAGPVLVVRPEPNPGLGRFAPEGLTVEHGFRPAVDRLLSDGHEVTPEAEGLYGLAILHITRQRDANRSLIARTWDRLRPGGRLVIDGAKTDGIDSLLKALRTWVPVDQTISKAHGKVAWTAPKETPFPQEAGWHGALDLSANPDGFQTSSLMFSPDHPDPGSALLAQVLPGRLRGQVADLGAGWGWLALQALDSNPEITAIDLIEAEHQAVQAARANVTDPRATVIWADATSLSAPDPAYDRVISNPPFHTGRKPDPSLGQAFILAAARILKPQGKFLMVANRQLPYEAELDRCFRHTQVLEQTGTYKVIEAIRPRSKV